MDLRQRFLAGGMSPSEAKREAELQRANQDLQHLEAVLDERVDAGLIHETELRRARLQVMRIELAQMRMEQLRVGRAGP